MPSGKGLTDGPVRPFRVFARWPDSSISFNTFAKLAFGTRRGHTASSRRPYCMDATQVFAALGPFLVQITRRPRDRGQAYALQPVRDERRRGRRDSYSAAPRARLSEVR